MNKIIYVCDKCRAEFPDANKLLNIRCELKPTSHYGGLHIGERVQAISNDVCITCAEKMGIIKLVVKKDKVIPEVQDVKDRLYAIVVELIQESGIPMEVEQQGE